MCSGMFSNWNKKARTPQEDSNNRKIRSMGQTTFFQNHFMVLWFFRCFLVSKYLLVYWLNAHFQGVGPLVYLLVYWIYSHIQGLAVAGPSLQSSRSGNLGPQKHPHFPPGRTKQSSHLCQCQVDARSVDWRKFWSLEGYERVFEV